VGNTANTVTIQQNEVAGNVGEEYTICAAQDYSNSNPDYEYTLGEVAVGDSFAIGMGTDENGFGDYWNKTITDMEVLDNTLYVSTGLNYEYGAQVWYTDDGDEWHVTIPQNTFGNYHEGDPDFPNFPPPGKPVSTSIPSLKTSSVSGREVLYASGTGATGNAGRCARMAKLTESGWELIVDNGVDENDEGTNENGFGGGPDCDMVNGNFMAWTMAHFDSKLFAATQRFRGARVLYTADGSSEDGSWVYVVGGDSPYPDGFDQNAIDPNTTFSNNITANLFTFGSTLYAGVVSQYPPVFGSIEDLTGSQIWKTADATVWESVTKNGFNDENTVNFEAFAVFRNQLYVSGSKGASASAAGLGGAKVFRLQEPRGFACPITLLLAEKNDIGLHILRACRDQILTRNEALKELSSVYYDAAPEVVSLLKRDPAVKSKALQTLEEIVPLAATMAAGERIALTPATLRTVDTLLTLLSEKGSPDLKTLAGKARRNLRNPTVLKALNISLP
jgi:hypothetical protein